MDAQTKAKVIVEPKKAANPMQEKFKLDLSKTRARTAAEVLDETIHNAQQAQGHRVTRRIFVP